MRKRLWLIVILTIICSIAVLGGWADSENVKEDKIVSFEQNTEEEKAVMDVYKKFQQAMIDKDTDTLNAIVVTDITFTHMSGKTQTKEEFFGEIEDGTLNYYAYELHDPAVTINGDHATITGSNTLTTKVYGISGEWTLPINAHFIRVNEEWICCN